MVAQVYSEIGSLRRVLVHSPGRELLHVTPANRRDHLYEDLIDLKGARSEHDKMVALLAQHCEVLQVESCLAEALALDAAREDLCQAMAPLAADKALQKLVAEAEAPVLAQSLIQGHRQNPGPLGQALGCERPILPPLANLFFTRDAGIRMGSAALVASMRHPSRRNEEHIARILFTHHPKLAAQEILALPESPHISGVHHEGGDWHPLSPDVLLVGLSERTGAHAIDILADKIFAATSFEVMVVAPLPHDGTAIHLDMVWTQIDAGVCITHMPWHNNPAYRVWIRKRGHAQVARGSDLKSTLADLGLPMDALPCGGQEPKHQAREQWGSGCNFFAIQPGLAISYGRHEHTLATLKAHGFRLLQSQAVAQNADLLNDATPTIIAFSGGELIRGGGGPRCMTCPIERAPI